MLEILLEYNNKLTKRNFNANNKKIHNNIKFVKKAEENFLNENNIDYKKIGNYYMKTYNLNTNQNRKLIIEYETNNHIDFKDNNNLILKKGNFYF